MERVYQPSHMKVGVFHEPGIHLHLTRQDRLERVGHVVPRRNFCGAQGQSCVGRDDAEFLLPRITLLAHLVPTLIELALVLVRPFLWNVVRSMRRAGRKIDKEGLIGHQRLLLANPINRVVGHVVGQVIAFFGGLVWFDRDRVPVERGRVPIRLAAEKAVEMLEPAAAGRPGVERPHGTGFPDGHLMALAELRGRIAVQFQGHGQRRGAVGANRVIARRGGGRAR